MGERGEVDRHPGTGQRAFTHVLYTVREGLAPWIWAETFPVGKNRGGYRP